MDRESDGRRDRPGDGSIDPRGRPPSRQPRWRRDFPIDRDREEGVARRDFTKFLVLTSLAFVVGQFWIIVQNFFRRRVGEPPIRRIAPLGELPVGAAKVFSYPDDESHAIVVRLAEDSLVAYDQACTHLLCPVIAQPDRGRFHCPCHNANFDIETGRVINGPPERPLTRVTLDVRGGIVYATGIEETTA